MEESSKTFSPRPTSSVRRWWLSHPMEIWSAVVAGLISLAVYLWSAAPNVTLLDSGEFIVAAQHFGVPHPTGYPLWTLLAWLFQLLPLGNAAWEINIFSGVTAALAVAVCAGTLTNLLRWFLEPGLEGRLAWIPPLVSTAFSLMFAFSVSMWSQAVIAEVYALHALLIGVFLALLYGWVRNPSHTGLMLWAFFTLALSFSNHHLTLTLAPLPYLLILLLRRRALPDWIFAGVLTVLLGYLCFAILSQQEAVLKASVRLLFVVLLGSAIFLWYRKFRIRWNIVAFLPFAVAAGLLPYAYMPIASSTNPPMNWGYARETAGFFYSINRSQYSGALSDKSLQLLGPLLGVKDEKVSERELPPEEKGSRLANIQRWVGYFWFELSRAFTPFAAVGYFASILFILRSPLPQRTWIYCLHIAFVLAAFLQPILDHARTDLAGWWLQMPYHTYTNLIFALLSGLGTGLLIAFLARRRQIWFWLAPLLLLLPILTFRDAEAQSSQRDRWFGWLFGYDMLKDLPRDSVLIGGTDPGRFVPTYMIFGESVQPPALKRDPIFDRRDLYIITQNALGDPFYMDYIRDHYGENRPAAKGAFEKWLGRENAYPEKPLILPSKDEVRAIAEEALLPKDDENPDDTDPNFAVFSGVLKWIWERNKENHPFYIEESFPIKWTYDHAIPHGLIYRLSPEKLDRIPPEAVKKDFAFWADYKKKLLENPEYLQDFDAQRSFSKLRSATGNIYRHWNMLPEAEKAYREALELWPANPEVISSLGQMLWDRQDFPGVMKLLETAYALDPNNDGILKMAAASGAREKLETELVELKKTWNQNPSDDKTFVKILENYAALGETNRSLPVLRSGLERFPTNVQALKSIASFAESSGIKPEFLQASEKLVALEPDKAMNHYIHARALVATKQTNESFQALQKALSMDPSAVRDLYEIDPAFDRIRDEELFKSILEPVKSPFPQAPTSHVSPTPALPNEQPPQEDLR